MFKIKTNTCSSNVMKNAIETNRRERTKADASRAMMYRNTTTLDFDGKFGSIQNQMKMLSVIDVNYKKCQAKGTSLPKQYERYPIHISKHGNRLQTEPNESENDKNISLRLKQLSQECSKEIKYKPKELSYYQTFLKEPVLIDHDLAMRYPFMKKLPLLSMKEIKKKSLNSNIFHNNDSNTINIEHKKDYLSTQTSPKRYTDSDLFFLKEEKPKNSKKYEPYTVCQPSNSAWISVNPLPSYSNYSSVSYSPLSPSIINAGMTKEKIANQTQQNEMNAFHKQKGISEFIDLTRIGGTNTNKSMQDWLDKTKGDFKKAKGICSGYEDMYHSYKGVVPVPFTNTFPSSS